MAEDREFFPGAHAHNDTYVHADPVVTIVYDGDGNPETVTEDGITTTFTYNADSTVATSERLGVVRTYTYVDGDLTAVA